MKQPARQLSASKIATPSRMPRQKHPPALDVIPFVMSPLTSCPHLGSDGSLVVGCRGRASTMERECAGQHRRTRLDGASTPCQPTKLIAGPSTGSRRHSLSLIHI